MLLNKYRLKLQMFAEDDDFEEVEDGDLPDTSEDNIPPDEEEETEDEEVEEVEEVEDDEDELDDDEDLDKKTKALIKYKKQAKEAQRKLEEMQEQQRLLELEKEEQKRIDDLKKTGVPEETAKQTAKTESKAKMMEAKLAKYEYAELEETYPSITNHRKDIEELREKYPDMTREEIYLAKFYKNASFEERRNIEAELSYKQRKAKNKGFIDGAKTKKEKVRLTRSEEASYKEARKFNPKMTRAKFYKSLNEEEEIDF